MSDSDNIGFLFGENWIFVIVFGGLDFCLRMIFLVVEFNSIYLKGKKLICINNGVILFIVLFGYY